MSRFRGGLVHLSAAVTLLLGASLISAGFAQEELTCVEGTPIPFSATATDAEDGDLSKKLIWVSDLDGVIGTGASFKALLSPGRHVVTASATDSLGVSTLAQVIVNVRPIGGATVQLPAPMGGAEFEPEELEEDSEISAVAEAAFQGPLDLPKNEWTLVSAQLNVANIRYDGIRTFTLIVREWKGKLPKRIEGDVAFLSADGQVASNQTTRAKKEKCEVGLGGQVVQHPCYRLEFDLRGEVAEAGGYAALQARPLGRALLARRWLINSSFRLHE